jgi:hypothetical protein
MLKVLNSLRRRWRLSRQCDAFREATTVRENIRQAMPDNVAVSGWNSYSQCDEDGITRECLRRIASATSLSKTFIEVGCGNGLENNTHQLVLEGFRGCWIDGNKEDIAQLRREVTSDSSGRLLVQHRFLTKENIIEVMQGCKQHLATEDVDFFSLDIDGNDIHLVRASLGTLRPKLLCVEYNGKFPPPTRLEMAYASSHRWDLSDYFGASLQSWVDALSDYTLVSCNISGVNAFFVRNDLKSLFTIYPTETLYQPPRYWLISQTGHPSSLRWLRASLAEGN